MKICNLTQCICVVTVLLCSALTQSVAAQSQPERVEDYYMHYRTKPGSSIHKNGIPVVEVAQNFMLNEPAWYYKLYGYWPESWQKIADAGLFTAELISVHGKVIQPDDNRLDFDGDLQYMYKGPQTAPVLACLRKHFDGSTQISYERLEERWGDQPQTYADQYNSPPAGLLSRPAHLVEHWRGEMGDLPTNRLRQHQRAVALAYHFAAYMFHSANGRHASWEELHLMGFAPLKPGTINPQTGQPWAGDGRDNDLLYRVDAPSVLACRMVGNDGKIKWGVLP
jgi:hypothetical protein